MRKMTMYSEDRGQHSTLEKKLEAEGLDFETVHNPNDHWPYRALVELPKGFDWYKFQTAA